MDRVEDYGVITVSKPISRQMFWSALKLARVAQRRITMAQKENAKLQKKLDSLKTVSQRKMSFDLLLWDVRGGCA